MALKDIMNRGACGATEQKGFNTNKGCFVPFNDITEIWYTPLNFEFDKNATFDEDYIKSVQKAGNLTILKDVQAFEAQNTEVQVSTSAKGFKQKTLDGIYEFKVTFEDSVWLQKQLGFLDGKRRGRYFLVSGDTIYGTEGKNGGVAGFRDYSTIRDLQTFAQGAEVGKQSIMIQFADHKELDDYPVLLDGDVLEFAPSQIEPIVQASVSFFATPSTASTSLGVYVVYDRGQKGEIVGLDDAAAFKVTYDGVTENLEGTLTTAPNGSQYYALTTSTAIQTVDGVVTVSLNGIQEVTGDCLYVSNTASEKAIAGL